MRDPNDLLTSDDLPRPRSDHDLDGLCFGSDDGDRRSEASSGGGSKIIGDITIAEYEGSPRRYKPRKSPPQKPKQQNQNARPPLRLPGFPQRVLPVPVSTASAAENVQAEVKDQRPVEVTVVSSAAGLHDEELLKFEDEQVASEEVKIALFFCFLLH